MYVSGHRWANAIKTVQFNISISLLLLEGNSLAPGLTLLNKYLIGLPVNRDAGAGVLVRKGRDGEGEYFRREVGISVEMVSPGVQ